MLLRLVIAGLVAAAAGALSAAHAQDKWNVLGSHEIDLGKDTQTIDLSSTRGSVKATRIRVRSGNLQLSNIEVRYLGDGKAYGESRKINLGQGERTRAIDPQKDERFLTSMTVAYSPQPGKKATIDVLGLQSAKGALALRPGTVTGSTGAGATPPAPAAEKPAIPGAGGAVLFGFQYAAFLRDRDVIKVGSEIGQFDRLQIRALDNDIFIDDVNVVYVDGEKQRLAVNANLGRNTKSRWFDIRGDKFIDRIEFTYRSRPSVNGQARVEVFGEPARGWLGPSGRGRKYNEGWVLLGAQTAGRFLRNETDIIPIVRNEGGFKRLRLLVKDRDLMLREIRVVFEDNQEQVFKANAKVTSGSTYGPMDLMAGTPIKQIRTTYRSAVLDQRAAGKGASVVEIWGQR
jgi:hypothetical protein